MNSKQTFSSEELRSRARFSGFLYLIMAISGPVGILWAPSQIIVEGDAIATAANVISQPNVIRIGVIASIVCQVAFLALVIALGHTFVGGCPVAKKTMFACVVAGVPIAMLNEVIPLAVIELSTFGDKWADLMLAGMNAHEWGIMLVSVFWGLWLFPFGWLVIKSKGRMPAMLGWLLILGGTSYIVDSILAIALPVFRASITDMLLIPLAVGELSMIVWLLVWGVNDVKEE